MRVNLLSVATAVGLLLISSQTIYANPSNSARILEDKAISYASQHANETNFDVNVAAQDISQEAMMLGKNYSHSYGLTTVSPVECLEEVAKLSMDSGNFAQNALSGQYRKIMMVDGNAVMLVASAAGTLTYVALDKGGFCNKEKSTTDAYWTARIFRLALGSINVAFS